MGIKGLAKLLADQAPGCFREQAFDSYFGRRIAIDASQHIYAFLVVVGRTGDQLLTSETGEITSHLQGMFFRTARLLESGMKPIYVFDGKPPVAKTEEIQRRVGKKDDAIKDLAEAKERGATEEEQAKYSKRSVRVTREQNEDCKRLLRLLGVPIIDAPSEAEAQCAAMCKADLVYAMSSEDMDSLTFGATRLVRNLMTPASAKIAINEYEYDKVLEGLQLTREQFIDVCILCGCDYCGSIRGIGPTRAVSLIQKHGTLEKVMDNLDGSKYGIPEPFPYHEARRLFNEPSVLPAEELPQLKWVPVDEQGVVDFLVGEKNFSEERVRKACVKMNASRGKASQGKRPGQLQLIPGRMDSFFKPAPGSSPKGPPKRKAPEPKGKGAKGKGKEPASKKAKPAAGSKAKK